MRTEIRSALLSRGFDLLNATLLGVFALLTVYPFVEILQISLSHPAQVEPEYRYALAAWAKTASFDIYGFILGWSRTLRGFGYSIYYTATGICAALVLNTLAAYPLSKRRLRFKGPVVVYIALTMFFSGGLIPTYLLVLNLGLVNTVWAIVLPTAFSAWHMIMMRTFFQQIPNEMEESAQIDGANDLVVLVRIYLPLCSALFATMTVYFFIMNWNAWFAALIYLDDAARYPIQLVLRDFVIQGEAAYEITGIGFYKGYYLSEPPVQRILGASIMVLTLVPIVLVYPFAQKYLIKGTMIGAIRG